MEPSCVTVNLIHGYYVQLFCFHVFFEATGFCLWLAGSGGNVYTPFGLFGFTCWIEDLPLADTKAALVTRTLDIGEPRFGPRSELPTTHQGSHIYSKLHKSLCILTGESFPEDVYHLRANGMLPSTAKAAIIFDDDEWRIKYRDVR